MLGFIAALIAAVASGALMRKLGRQELEKHCAHVRQQVREHRRIMAKLERKIRDVEGELTRLMSLPTSQVRAESTRRVAP